METRTLTSRDKAAGVLAEKIRGHREKTCHRTGEEKDIFQRICYIFPRNVKVENYPRKPFAVFNPGAALKGQNVEILPRLVFDYYWYSASIGRFKLRVEDLILGGVPEEIECRIVIYPSLYWDLKGCEDPRVYTLPSGEDLVLYTGVSPSQGGVTARQGLGLLHDEYFCKMGYLTLEYRYQRYETFWKDSAILEWETREPPLLMRPAIPLPSAVVEIGWFGYVDKADFTVSVEEMKPLLFPIASELKVGWSTNALKISSDEYLVGWHGVGRDLVYRNGLALISSCGDLLGISEYLLSPRGDVLEFYGDQPGVIFGDGLIKYSEKLIWIGGVSDYAIGVFSADIDKVLENIHECR
ncbi:MAG: hypothetical protein LM590_04060 [Thermofilum sp.]|nr:hypothetical protein [Thermofilum sp.]